MELEGRKELVDTIPVLLFTAFLFSQRVMIEAATSGPKGMSLFCNGEKFSCSDTC